MATTISVVRGADRRMYLCRNEDLVVKKWRRYLELVIIVSPPALEMHKTRQRPRAHERVTPVPDRADASAADETV